MTAEVDGGIPENVSVKEVWLAASGRVYSVISLNGTCIERKGGSGVVG
eukprot:COSAG03_NODE_24686_length_270_cov_1.450292_2_plen_47_part_01